MRKEAHTGPIPSIAKVVVMSDLKHRDTVATEFLCGLLRALRASVFQMVPLRALVPDVVTNLKAK